MCHPLIQKVCCGFLQHNITFVGVQALQLLLFKISCNVVHRSLNCRYFCFQQISSHVKAIDTIYQSTDFSGIRNISFMVKRIRVSCAGNTFSFTCAAWRLHSSNVHFLFTCTHLCSLAHVSLQ